MNSGTKAALHLATELGGRMLFDQLNRAVTRSIDELKDQFDDDQIANIRRVMATSLMENMFNPAFAESEHANGFSLQRDLVQVGLCRCNFYF